MVERFDASFGAMMILGSLELNLVGLATAAMMILGSFLASSWRKKSSKSSNFSNSSS